MIDKKALITIVAACWGTTTLAQSDSNCDRLKADYPGLYYVCLGNGAQEKPKSAPATPQPQQKDKAKSTLSTQDAIAKR